MGRPLEGIRVLYLPTKAAGLFSFMVLEDLGVEAIKFELPAQGDGARTSSRYWQNRWT